MGYSAQKTTAGAALQIVDNSALHYKKLYIRALAGNAGDMTLGLTSQVNATSGLIMDGGDYQEIDISRDKQVWIFGAASHTASYLVT